MRCHDLQRKPMIHDSLLLEGESISSSISWKHCLGTSYVYCRFRNWYKSLFYRSYNLHILTDWYKNSKPSLSSTLSLYHLVSTFIGILLTFSPMHFLGFNVIPRRVPDFPDSFHSWNFLSSIGSGITFLSFAIFS